MSDHERPAGPPDHGDPLGGLLAQLRGQPPPAPFAPATAVRARGRRRARRQLAVAGVATVAVIGLGAAALAAATERAAPVATAAPPAASPAPTAGSPEQTISPGWFLTLDDLGAGWVGNREADRSEDDPAWFWAGFCDQFRVEDYPSLVARQDLAVAGWQRPDEPVSTSLDQVLEVFADATAAADNLVEIRTVVAGCRQEDPPGAAAADQVHLSILDTGFAGDESLLIQSEVRLVNGVVASSQPAIAVVRVGAAVTTLVLHSGDATLYLSGRLAQQAADRLR